MLEASDPNNSCSRLCTCGLGQQLPWNYTGRLSRCLMVLDGIRMMSGSSHAGGLLFSPTPNSSELLGSSFRKPEEVVGFFTGFPKK